MGSPNNPSHVVIIGGGIIGCSTAFYLSALGHHNVTVLEQCDIACHSSGKAGGFLARNWCKETDLSELAQKSYALHMELAEKYPDLDYRGVDTFQVSTSHQSAPGNEVFQRKPALHWLSSDHVTGVELLDTSKNTAKVSPKLLCVKLLNEAKSKGTVVKFVKVTGIKSVVSGESSRVIHVIVSGIEGDSIIPTDSLVIATGPWTTNFIQEHFPHFSLPSIRPQTRAHSVLLQPANPVGSECIFQYHKTMSGATVDPEIYPLPDGTVYVCGEVDEVPLPEAPHLIQPDLDKCQDLIIQASHAAKCLGSAKVLARQACYLPDSSDHIPIIGKMPGLTNVFIGTAHTFWGILNGPATGKCLAELILNGKAETCDISKFDPARFL